MAGTSTGLRSFQWVSSGEVPVGQLTKKRSEGYNMREVALSPSPLSFPALTLARLTRCVRPFAIVVDA